MSKNRNETKIEDYLSGVYSTLKSGIIFMDSITKSQTIELKQILKDVCLEIILSEIKKQ